MLIPLKFRQSQFFANLVIANAQLLNLLIRHVYLPASFKIDAVDDAVRVDVFTINVGADQHLATFKISCQPPSCFVRRARVNVRTLRETLHHVVKLDTAVLVVQQFRTQEFVECGFRLTANAAGELLSIPARFPEL